MLSDDEKNILLNDFIFHLISLNEFVEAAGYLLSITYISEKINYSDSNSIIDEYRLWLSSSTKNEKHIAQSIRVLMNAIGESSSLLDKNKGNIDTILFGYLDSGKGARIKKIKESIEQKRKNSWIKSLKPTSGIIKGPLEKSINEVNSDALKKKNITCLQVIFNRQLFIGYNSSKIHVYDLEKFKFDFEIKHENNLGETKELFHVNEQRVLFRFYNSIRKHSFFALFHLELKSFIAQSNPIKAEVRKTIIDRRRNILTINCEGEQQGIFNLRLTDLGLKVGLSSLLFRDFIQYESTLTIQVLKEVFSFFGLKKKVKSSNKRRGVKLLSARKKELAMWQVKDSGLKKLKVINSNKSFDKIKLIQKGQKAICWNRNGNIGVVNLKDESINEKASINLRSREKEFLYEVLYTADNKILAFCTKEVRCINIDTGKTITKHEDVYYSEPKVEVLKKGELAISYGHHNNLYLWDLRTSKLVRTFQGWRSSRILKRYSNSGAVSVENGKISFWDFSKSTKRELNYHHHSEVNKIQLYNDKKNAVSISQDGTMKVFDLTKLSCLSTIRASSLSVNDVQIYEWGKGFNAITASGEALQEKFISDSSYKNFTIDNSIRVWDLDNDKCLKAFTDFDSPISKIAFVIHEGYSRANVMIIDIDGTMYRFEDYSDITIDYNQKGFNHFGKGIVNRNSSIIGQYSRNEKMIICGDEGDILKWHFYRQYGNSYLKGHKREILSMDFSRNRNILLTASKDGTTKIWILSDERCFRTIKSSGVKTALFIEENLLKIKVKSQVHEVIFEKFILYNRKEEIHLLNIVDNRIIKTYLNEDGEISFLKKYFARLGRI